MFRKKEYEKMNVSQTDLKFGFEFIFWLQSNGYSPFDLLGNKSLTEECLEKFNNERNGQNVKR